jgi:hypothetical protein
MPALAAAVTMPGEKEFFSNLLDFYRRASA